jgi:hypothetical protein
MAITGALTGCVPLTKHTTLILGVGLVNTQGTNQTQVTRSVVLGAAITPAPNSFSLGLSTESVISTSSTNVVIH